MTLKKAVIFVGRELYITLTSHSRCLSAGADKLTGAELLLDQAELRHVGECESLRESYHSAGDIGSSVRPVIVTDRKGGIIIDPLFAYTGLKCQLQQSVTLS